MDQVLKSVGENLSQDKQLWWGYKHTSGTLQAKRYFSKLDIDEAIESDFVADVVFPFLAKDRDEALGYINEQTKNM